MLSYVGCAAESGEVLKFRNTLLVIVENSIIVLPSVSAMYLRNLSHKIVLTETVSSHSLINTKI